MIYNEYIKNRKKINNIKRFKLKNGFGSISYLGANRSKPFMLRAPATYDDFGKEHRKIIGYTDDYYEGIELLIKYNKDPKCIEKNSITFSEMFTLWSEYEIRENNKLPENKKRKEAFSSNYISVFNNQCQSLYKKPIVEITISDMQSCIDNCEHGFSTKKYIKLLCGKLFKYAKFLGINIDLDLIKMLKVGSPDKSDMHKPFTEAEKRLLWDNLGNKKIDPYSIIDTILITIYEGLRPSELLELQNINIDLKRKVAVGGNKTKAGINREVPLHDKIIPLIKQRINKDNIYLVTDKNGLKYNYRHYLDIYKDVMLNLGIEHLPHDGRDTAATEMYNAGVKELIYKLILGHQIEDVTEKHYIKITLEQKLEAINCIK